MKFIWIDFIKDNRYHRQCFPVSETRELLVTDSDWVMFMLRDTPRHNTHCDLVPPFEPLPHVEEGGVL